MAEVMAGVHESRYLTMQDAGDGRRLTAPITSFLFAGCGFGGSCLPKDVSALVAHGRILGEPMTVLDAVLTTNMRQPQRTLDIVKRHFPSLSGIKATVLGLAFKPDTDDVRESPGLWMARELKACGASVSLYDPVAMETAKKVLPDEMNYHSSLASSLQDADVVLIMTAWDVFRTVPDLLAGRSNQPLVVDGRRILDPRRVTHYKGIGFGN
jgi:UDPglucose 6-dehydrogenase/GDP-mannose 6-dehydrogenase